MSTSRDYAKFKRLFVGPVLKRKQRIAIMPRMPVEDKEYIPHSKYKVIPLSELSPEDKKKAEWSAYIVERRKKRDKSMPVWADKNAIKEMYSPSNHPLVCGLHVENNLQIITEKENIIKSNTFCV